MISGHVAVTTTLGAGTGGLTALLLNFLFKRHWSLERLLNGILGGLVCITAGCAFVEAWASLIIGIIGGLVYYGGAQLLFKLKIDDPVEASVVHGFCGIWGVLATGLFASPYRINFLFPPNPDAVNKKFVDFGYRGRGLFYAGVKSGYPEQEEVGPAQFGVQLLGILCIVIWVSALASLVFFILRKVNLLRISDEHERQLLQAKLDELQVYFPFNYVYLFPSARKLL